MDVAKLARGLALNRISFGAGLIAARGIEHAAAACLVPAGHGANDVTWRMTGTQSRGRGPAG